MEQALVQGWLLAWVKLAYTLLGTGVDTFTVIQCQKSAPCGDLLPNHVIGCLHVEGMNLWFFAQSCRYFRMHVALNFLLWWKPEGATCCAGRMFRSTLCGSGPVACDVDRLHDCSSAAQSVCWCPECKDRFVHAMRSCELGPVADDVAALLVLFCLLMLSVTYAEAWQQEVGHAFICRTRPADLSAVKHARFISCFC